MSTVLNQKTVSIIGFIILVLSVLVLLVREALLAHGFIPIAVQCISFMLMIWARVTFGLRSFHAAANPTQGGLITSGPYKFLRHPIYASILYFIWAGILTHISIMHVILGIIAIGGTIVRISAEEKLIKVQYPDYVDYATRTKRIIPFIL